MHAPPTRIALIDDHRLFIDGITASFVQAGFDVVAVAHDGVSAVEAVLHARPDVILMDISMPLLSGIDAIRRIRAAWPTARILVLTMHDDPALIATAVESGAIGYLDKTCTFAEIATLARIVAEASISLSADLAQAALNKLGNAPRLHEPLTDRQLQILKLVASGETTQKVGMRLGISRKTVNNHLGLVYQRLQAANLTQAVLRAARLGIIDLQ
jgi:DNA-binding NarL/FixJ family response regulator